MDTGVYTSPHSPATSPQESVSLTRWQRAAGRARAAQQMGQWRIAAKYHHQALALALCLLEPPTPPGREDDCVAAVVVSHLNVADLLAHAAATDDAAQCLCRAHTVLLGLMADARHGPALQQAAWRHSRETHAALLNHVQAYGAHPSIAQTLTAAPVVGAPARH